MKQREERHPNAPLATRLRVVVRAAMVGVVALWCAACSVPELPKDLAQENEAWLRSQAQEATRAAPSAPRVPEQVQAALFGQSGETGRDAPEKTINVSVEALPASEFFFGVIGGTGANVVVHPDVKGAISLDLRDVTLEEVLALVQELYGYEYRQRGNTYSISPPTLRTELFELNYLDIQRVGVTDTTVVGGEAISSTDSPDDEGAANLLGYLQNVPAGGDNLTPGTRIQTLNRTDLWQSLRAALLTLVGGEGEGRAVVINPQSGVIVVKAFPRELALVKRFLKVSEGNLIRQVVLETKIVEVELTQTNNAGINWSAIVSGLSLDSTRTSANNEGIPEFLFSPATIKTNALTFVLNDVDIAQLVDLLAQQGTVKVLSSPRISTVNNQKAVIRVGSDEFFVTGIENTTTTTGTAITASPDIKLSPFFSGISLDVTPQVSDDGEIILHIHPVISQVTDQDKELIVGNDTFSFPLALREVRESDSVVRARSGQLVVLGGLMQEKKETRQSDRPPFSELLPLNFLFRNQSVNSKKTELVILMKPEVITRNVPKGFK